MSRYRIHTPSRQAVQKIPTVYPRLDLSSPSDISHYSAIQIFESSLSFHFLNFKPTLFRRWGIGHCALGYQLVGAGHSGRDGYGVGFAWAEPGSDPLAGIPVACPYGQAPRRTIPGKGFCHGGLRTKRGGSVQSRCRPLSILSSCPTAGGAHPGLGAVPLRRPPGGGCANLMSHIQAGPGGPYPGGVWGPISGRRRRQARYEFGNMPSGERFGPLARNRLRESGRISRKNSAVQWAKAPPIGWADHG